MKNVTKLRHCWKAWNKQISFKLGWALQGCINLPKNVPTNATRFQHMHYVGYFLSFSSCMYPFFPLTSILLNVCKTKNKQKKLLLSKTCASNKRQGAYEDFFGICTCRKFNMILDHDALRCIMCFGPHWPHF